MGCTKRAQLGQMTGAMELLFADKIPATKVLCMHAILLVLVHAPDLLEI